MTDSIGQMTRTTTADAKSIADAVCLLAEGSIVAIPTETVYGLAADAAQGEAVAKVYAAKGRPDFNPLIVHVVDVAMARTLARFDARAECLAKAFWPGGLTLVLPRLENVAISPLVTAGLDTIAIRVPAHPIMQAVLRGLGRGLAAPSANASGRISPTQAEHVRQSLEGRIPLILDAGPCAQGLESSIVGLADNTPRLLRQGAIARETIEDALGQPLLVASESDAIVAPGMLLRHYAPRLPMRLDAVHAHEGEYHIGFGDIAGDTSLSPSSDLVEAAARLFELLHVAEVSGRAGIAVAPIPMHGLGAAINDRLGRAARG